MALPVIIILTCINLALAIAPPAPGDGKQTIAVLNLKTATGVTVGEAELLSDRLRIEFFNTGKFTVMERDQMQQVLKEQGFQQSGACTDEACMVEIGQLLGVKQLVTGSVGKLGNMFMINIRSIDVQTGKIARVVSQDVKGDIEDFVGVLPDIAARLAADAPSERKVFEKQERRREEPPPPPKEEVRREETRPEIKMTCANRLLFQELHFTRADLQFDLKPDEYEDLNKDVNEELIDALNEVFDEMADLIPAQHLAQIPSCTAPVLRINLDKYTARSAGSREIEGTVEVTLSFFERINSPTAAFRVRVIRTGDSSREQGDAFIEAFKSVAEEIEDKLDRQDYIRKLQKRLRK